MEFFSLENWEYKKDLEGVLLFVERLNELSFDYTSYIHKANRPSVRTICKECINLARRYEVDKYKSYLKEVSILEHELYDKLRFDNISKHLIGHKREMYLSAFKNKEDTRNFISTLELLILRLSYTSYLEECKIQLIEVLKQPKHKEKIYTLTERFYETVLEAGYEQGTIYYLIRNYFFSRSRLKKIANIEDSFGFFDYFDLNKSEYSVIFKASNLFEQISDSCKYFNIEINKTIKDDNIIKKSGIFTSNKREKHVFIRCNKIYANDYLAARTKAEEKVRLIADLLNFFHHKNLAKWEPKSLVVHIDKNDVRIMEKPTNKMTKISDNRPQRAATYLNQLLSKFNLRGDSFQRFNRAIELHSLATRTEEGPNQIVNLWTCFETLLVGTSTGTKIELVEKNLTPFLVNGYIPYLLMELTHELKQWDNDKLNKAIKRLPDEYNDIHFSVAAIVSIREHEEIAVDLLKNMDKAPLLRLKMMKLIKSLQNTHDIKSLIEEFKIRISRDIRRLYRSRNAIIHLGKTSKETLGLVEIAHTFIDMILSTLYETKVYEGRINSIEHSIQEQHMTMNYYINFLSKKQKCDQTNFIDALFGPDYK